MAYDKKDFKKDYKKDNNRDYKSLDNGSLVPDEADDRIEGRNPCLEALKSGRPINKIVVQRGEKEGSIRRIISDARKQGIMIQEVDKQSLDRMSTTRSHQGIIAFVSPKEYVEIADILAIAAEKNEMPFIILLDEITDVQNFGAILRTADAVGAHGIVIPKRRSVSLSSMVAKASAGAMEHVPVARVSNLATTISTLKDAGLWIVGTETGEGEIFYNADFKMPICLVIGSEGFGMGKLISEKCDILVNIPMTGKISSLNASVAGGIVLYEIFRQRNLTK